MLGTATGPMFAGRIFDVSGAYTAAFILMSMFLAVAALLPFGCLPFSAPYPPQPRRSHPASAVVVQPGLTHRP